MTGRHDIAECDTWREALAHDAILHRSDLRGAGLVEGPIRERLIEQAQSIIARLSAGPAPADDPIEDEPARPVEDREPPDFRVTINPPPAPAYPPQDGVTWASGSARRCRSGHFLTPAGHHGDGQEWCSADPVPPAHVDIGSRLDGLIDVVSKMDARLAGRLDQIADLLPDESPGGEPLLTQSAANAYGQREYDRGVADGRASVQTAELGYTLGKNAGMRDIDIRVDAAFNRGLDKGYDRGKADGRAECTTDHSAEPVQMVQFKEAFERGRQQGDADRAARGQAEYERGLTEGRMIAGLATECTIDHSAERGQAAVDGFTRGKAIGRAAIEAELLDQGWTPPGITSVDARLLEIVNSDVNGPTDYEVWRDALTMSATMHAPSQPSIGKLPPEPARIISTAEWFWEALQDVPVLKGDDGTDTDNDVQTDPRMGTGND